MNFQTFRKMFVCNENIYTVRFWGFFNKSTYVAISEEQKAYLYLLPQKACVQEYVPAKQTFVLSSPVETDPGFFLKLLLTTLDSNNTLTLTWFFPAVLLHMEFLVQGMKIGWTSQCFFCYSLAYFWAAADTKAAYIQFESSFPTHWNKC